MESAELPIIKPFSAKLPLTVAENKRIRSFLKSSDRKAGAWLRTLAIRAMNEEAGLGDSSGQARELAEFVAAHLPPDQLRALADREDSVEAHKSGAVA